MFRSLTLGLTIFLLSWSAPSMATGVVEDLQGPDMYSHYDLDLYHGGGGLYPRCVRRCIERSLASGECHRYGEDFCGINAACVPYCERRSSVSDKCRDWGPDYCSAVDGCEVRN